MSFSSRAKLSFISGWRNCKLLSSSDPEADPGECAGTRNVCLQASSENRHGSAPSLAARPQLGLHLDGSMNSGVPKKLCRVNNCVSTTEVGLFSTFHMGLSGIGSCDIGAGLVITALLSSRGSRLVDERSSAAEPCFSPLSLMWSISVDSGAQFTFAFFRGVPGARLWRDLLSDFGLELVAFSICSSGWSAISSVQHFCACVRIWTAVRVCTISAIFFHCRGCSCMPWMKIECSSGVHRPTAVVVVVVVVELGDLGVDGLAEEVVIAREGCSESVSPQPSCEAAK